MLEVKHQTGFTESGGMGWNLHKLRDDKWANGVHSQRRFSKLSLSMLWRKASVICQECVGILF